MDAITVNSNELQELMAAIYQARSDIGKIKGTHRPSIANERYYTGEELCSRLHMSKRALQNYRDNGIIPFTKIGDKILYRDSDIMRILEENHISEVKY